MRHLITLLVLVCALAGYAAAQQAEVPFILVEGSSERTIIPDKFIFKITLTERVENKKKVTIEQLEQDLRGQLSSAGFDVGKDLSVYDISIRYTRQKRMSDVLGTRDYRLEVTDINKIASLQDIADRVNVTKLDLVDTDVTDMTRHRREVKIEALKAAQEKAKYLLEAVGQHLGRTLYVAEGQLSTSSVLYSSSSASNTFVVDGQEVSNYRSNSVNSNNVSFSPVRSDQTVSNLEFAPVKIRYVMTAKFAIE